MWSWDQRQSSSALAPRPSYAAPTTDEDFLEDDADLFGAPSEDYQSLSETHHGLLGLWSAFRDTANALAQPQLATQDAETADMMETTTTSEPAAAGVEQMRQSPPKEVAPTEVAPAKAQEEPPPPVATPQEDSAAPPESANDAPTLPQPDISQEDTAMTGVVQGEQPASDPVPSLEPTAVTGQDHLHDLAATLQPHQPPVADLIADLPTGEPPEHIGDTHTTGVETVIAGDGQQLVEEPTAGPMALDPLNGEPAWYGPADGQLAPGPVLDADALDLAAAASVENRQCAFAKLEFPDGDFYMTTYAVELGRDARAFKQEMRKKLQKDDGNAERHRAVSVMDPPHTPVRPNAPSVVSVARSNLSECGGIMGGDDAHVNVSSRRKKKKKSKSASSSSQHPSRKSSLAAYPGTGTDYNSLALASLRNNGSYNQDSREHTFLPDPYEVPLIPLHPPISEDGPAGHKGISRKHLKICYSFESNSFEMSVLGRNGAFLNGVIHTPNDPAAQLHDGDRIQIGHIPFMFRLPNMPMSDGEDGGESSDSFSGGISLNFEDGRGESIVVDDESSDDDGYKLADQYSFSPHYGWPSEEEFSGEDMDEGDDVEEPAPKIPKLKLKLGPKTKERKREAREEARANKKKKKKKLKAEAEPKAPRKTVPKPAAKEKPSKKPKEDAPQKTTVKETIEKPVKPVQPAAETQVKEEPVNQDTIVPSADVPQPSTEVPPQPEKSTSEKPPAHKTSGGFRVLTAEEAEKLGLEPGYVVERKKGPGRPPKDGIMSKREKAEIMRRKKEAEKAKKLGLNPEEIAKIDLSKPRKEPKEGEPKPGAEKKPKSAEAEGAASESAPPEDGSQTAEKKPAKTPRPVRSPSPEMKESDYTEEQLQRPAANYVVLIHEAISNSRDGKLNLQQIYSAIERKYPYYKFKTSTTGWQSSVRHNLGQHDAFRKAEKEGKGWMWAINPGVSIEKERRKRNTPPPPSQPPRPYYHPMPPHGQSPYMMAPPGVPGYQPHPSPYAPRPPVINGAAPAAPPGQPAYQSPYAPRPAGQSGQAAPPPRPSPYAPVGVRPPYQPYAASPYAPPTSSSSMPSASGSMYPTAGPGPYQSTSAYTPGYTSTAGPSPYQPRPPYPPQPSQASPAQAAGSLATQQSGHPGAPAPPHPSTLTQTPLPPRKAGIYEGTEKWAILLDNFRRLFIQGTTTRGWQGQERIDRLAVIVDRGMERALHPHRFVGEPEPKNEEETLDRKEERQVVDAVYEMLRKHYGITDPPGLFRQSGPQQQPPPPPHGQPHPNQPPTGQPPAAAQTQTNQPPVVQPPTAAPQAQPAQQPQAQALPGQAPSQPTPPQQARTSSITAVQSPPGPPQNPPASGPSQAAAPAPPANGPSAPTSHPNTPAPNISSAPPSDAPPLTATSAPAPTNPPQPNGIGAVVSVGTPRAPEVEALTPVEGMSKPGTPASGTGPSSVPPPSTAAMVAGIKRGPDGEAVGGAEQEAKKVKVEGDA